MSRGGSSNGFICSLYYYALTETHLPEHDVLWSIPLVRLILLLNQKYLNAHPSAMNLQDKEMIDALISSTANKPKACRPV